MRYYSGFFFAVLLTITQPDLIFAAPIGESGSEIWVDGPLDLKPGGDPRWPDADVDHRGRQVFVWEDDPRDGTDLDIFMRVFNAAGTSLVGPVKVNTFDTDTQIFPHVAMALDGSFLVVWNSWEPPNPEDAHKRVIIRSQLFDSNGQPDGNEQILSTVKTLIAGDARPDLTALPGGGYVVVWESSQSADMNDTSYTIQGRLVGTNGVPSGDQFQVNALMTGTLEGYSSVAALADGGFVVTWARPQIHGRRFMADGTPVGGDFQVNTYVSLHSRDETNVAVNEDGRVLVVWTDREERLNSSEIRGRLYSPTLSPLGPDFRINTYETDAQNQPTVAGYGKGGFFVIWRSTGSSGPDAEPTSIEGRIVSGAEAFASPQFLVNRYTLVAQSNPGIGGRGGRVAIAWFSRSNADTSQNVIMGQLWNICGIYCDSFESDDN